MRRYPGGAEKAHITLGVCDTMMGNYAVVAKRIYETRPGFEMQWHSDVGNPCINPAIVDGLVFIVYLQDATTGYVQYLRDSFKEGEHFIGGLEMDARIAAERTADIVDNPMSKGSCVIYIGGPYTEPSL